MRRWTTPARPPWCFGLSLLGLAKHLAGTRLVMFSPRCRRGRSWTGPRLVEKRQLIIRLRVLQARQANPDQPNRPRLDVRLLQRRTRGAEDRLDVVGRARPAHLAAHQPEVRELELYVDRARAHVVGLQPLDHPIGELAQRMLELAAIAHIVFERGLGRDRLRWLAAVDGGAVAALGHAL